MPDGCVAQGGTPHTNLDVDRLLKAGYLALSHGQTVTSLTERGRDRGSRRS